MKIWLAVPLLWLSSLQLPGQIRGHVEGFVFDAPTHSIRPVVGMPGSARLGGPIVSGLEFGSVAPRHSHGIGIRDGKWLSVSRLGDGTESLVDLPELPRTPEAVAWSGDGTVAAVYSTRGHWIQVVTGLPDSPVLGAAFEEPTAGSIHTVILDARGQRIVITRSGGDPGVFDLAGGAPARLAGIESAAAAICFSASGTLYALEGGSARLYEIDLTSGTVRNEWTLDRAADALAIRVIARSGGRFLAALTGGERTIELFDLESRQHVASIPVEGEGTGFEPLGKGTFALGGRRDGAPLWVFRDDEAQPAIYFVPATPISAEEGGVQ